MKSTFNYLKLFKPHDGIKKEPEDSFLIGCSSKTYLAGGAVT